MNDTLPAPVGALALSYDKASILARFPLRAAYQMTITSASAGGRSTLLEGLRAALGEGFAYVSAGSFMRKIAATLGMSIEQFAEHASRNPDYDARCDKMMADAALESEQFVGEGRVPHIMAPRAFHVRIVCPVQVRAERRFLQLRMQARDRRAKRRLKYVETLKAVLDRDITDAERYEALYPGYDWPDEHFDLVVENECLSPEQTLEKVLAGFSEHRKRFNGS
ncbi:MAG: hypothetical protein KGI69_03670 [Patescibacteria group bacterium]|nr:hypothetical protein [Patescibacteria group bacterium]